MRVLIKGMYIYIYIYIWGNVTIVNVEITI
jgi:hypothetical protein